MERRLGMTEEENKREMEYWLGKIILTTLREKRIITDEEFRLGRIALIHRIHPIIGALEEDCYERTDHYQNTGSC